MEKKKPAYFDLTLTSGTQSWIFCQTEIVGMVLTHVDSSATNKIQYQWLHPGFKNKITLSMKTIISVIIFKDGGKVYLVLSKSWGVFLGRSCVWWIMEHVVSWRFLTSHGGVAVWRCGNSRRHHRVILFGNMIVHWSVRTKKENWRLLVPVHMNNALQ